VHVRRGDVAFFHEQRRDLFNVAGALLSKDYFDRAMSVFGPDVTYLVFSESEADMRWCRANIQAPDLYFSTDNSDLFDFVAMSACDHHIISNSTFSWWAAWLNCNPRKIVVAPRQWFRAGYKSCHRIRDLIPEPWLLK
jgi:Glycosyl transferase family 11